MRAQCGRNMVTIAPWEDGHTGRRRRPWLRQFRWYSCYGVGGPPAEIQRPEKMPMLLTRSRGDLLSLGAISGPQIYGKCSVGEASAAAMVGAM